MSLVNLQGSVYGPSYYINLGVYLRGSGDATNPRLVDWHLRIRLGQLVPDPKRLAELLDLKQPLPEAARFAELERLLVEYALPWLNGLSTVETIRALLSGEQGRGVMIMAETRRLAGLANDA